ncbi:MAG: CoA transferase [Proteobacteria bacterium]|nr:CoA transferase [Pseudomonadota bacterium]
MTELGPFQAGALAGVRVLDLSRVIAGPYVGRLMVDMGADCIKVEPPEGDQMRLIAPNFDQGMSAFFTMANVGKQSVCLDLKQPEGVAVLLDLVRWAHLVVENFRPGVIERLGLGWEVLRGANPAVVLLSLNGYGRGSAWSQRMAYAPMLHAATGILQDQAQYAGLPVAQINHAHADTTAALHGAFAALAALRVAERTGVGQHVEIPMFDAVLTTYTEAYNALLPEPDYRVMNPIYEAGSHGAVATGGEASYVFAKLSQRYDIPDPGGADRQERLRTRRAAIEKWMATYPDRESVLEAVQQAGIACAPVVSLVDALRGEIAEERDLLVPVDDRRGGTRPVIAPAARLSETENRVRGRAPERGEHNDAVLREVLGYGDDRIAALRDAGVLREETQSATPEAAR